MLEQFLVSQVYTFFLIVCRIGSGIMVLPGYGETYVSPRIKLSFSLLISLILTPALQHMLPPMPASALGLALLVANEILIGVFLGGICRIIISVVDTAGMIYSIQSGISSAVIFDANQNSQGSLIGNFFGITIIALLFSTDMHYFMLRGITESYLVFTPGKLLPFDDFTKSTVRMASDAFIMAVQIAAPVIIVGTLLFLAAGVISRLMPMIQIFFVLVAPQLLIGFFIFATTFSAIMLFYMEFYRDKIMSIMGYVH